MAEFRFMTNAFDSQYGRQSGGTLNVTVKSGSNNYHRNLYEFNRNSAFSANTFQANRSGLPKSPTHDNLYAARSAGRSGSRKSIEARRRRSSSLRGRAFASRTRAPASAT